MKVVDFFLICQTETGNGSVHLIYLKSEDYFLQCTLCRCGAFNYIY